MRIANVALGNTKKHGPYAPRLVDWLRTSGASRPDIVTLQKVGPSKHFPAQELGNLKYESTFLPSPRDYLGVAILSHRNLPLPEVLFCDLPDDHQPESRFLTVNIGGLWVSSVYAPYGPTINHRVEWLHRLRKHVYHLSYAHRASLLCGDFNVKLDEKLGRSGDYTCYEQTELRALLDSDVGFVDLYRQQHPDLRKLGGTRGYKEDTPEGTSRLHLILASGSLARRMRDARLDRPDVWPRPDAPPLIVEFEDLAHISHSQWGAGRLVLWKSRIYSDLCPSSDLPGV